MSEHGDGLSGVRLSRRQVVTGLVTGATTLGVAAALGGSNRELLRVPDLLAGNQIVFRPDGYPRFLYLTTGRRVDFSGNRLRQVQAEATIRGELEVIGAYAVPKVRPKADLELHPVLARLPDDVVSEEGLAARGIRIIQPVSSGVRLYIREGAFDDGGPLVGYQGKREKLVIGLVDGPVVNAAYMRSSEYAGIVPYMKDIALPTFYGLVNVTVMLADGSLDQGARAALENSGLMVKKLRAERNGVNGRDWVSKADELDQWKRRQWMMEHLYDTVDQAAAYPLNALAWGKYYAAGENQTGVEVALIAVGGRREAYDVVVCYFDRNGQLGWEVTADEILGRRAMVPTETDAFPDVSYIKPPEQLGSYFVPAEALTPGVRLDHELAHGLTKYEGEADFEAYRRLTTAWREWVVGRRIGVSDRRFYFVFRMEDGKFIQTRRVDSGVT